MTTNELKEILENHKKWLVDYSNGEKADLHGADLTGANLRMTNLSWANLRRANLPMANLSDTDLRDTNLRDANLRGADLRGADLRDANLCGVNLCGADLDYSAWPLWCGSFDVKVDKRIAAQLAYHFCRLDCDDPEYQEAKKTLSKLANQFHRVGECGEVTPHESNDVNELEDFIDVAISANDGIEQKILPTETCSLCGDTTFEGRYGLIASLQAVAEDQRNFCPNCGRAI